MEDVFKLKQFDVRQDKCAMKVNTDGLILGAWSDISGKKRSLDIGAGTGIIALMLAQRNLKLESHAIEVDDQAFEQCTQNIRNSPFSDRLTCIHDSIQSYAADAQVKYDLIVSNPPFFSGGTFSLNENKANVRHTIKLSHVDLLRAVKNLLNDNGHFDVILPYLEGLRFIEMASMYDLGCVRIVEVRPRAEKNIERLLIRFEKKYDGLAQTESLVIHKSDQVNDYTDEMIAMTREFYLFME
ncbi:MAG TPA: methyltransferase [Saprospiraceae bacterium]|jgi:tRNA1Val (adenine37-N6)-methyltransferase|nr:methyltransferase [Saprospiraceae bacterium]